MLPSMLMPRQLRFKQAALIALVSVIALPCIALAGLWLTLPSVTQLAQRAQAPTTKILDRHGRLLYEVIDEQRDTSGRHTPVRLERIPLHLRQATIAVEDANFYTNSGVDVVGIARALSINLRGGETLAGGSTITQQLARMLLLDPDERAERTLVRKLRELMLAWQIAGRYTKDEVLALYLNEAYYGNLAYGVEAAARSYFGKSASELDLAECALLAGLPQSPAAYDPFNDPGLAHKRQRIVLDLMVKQRYITASDALTAARTPLLFAPARFDIRAPHFVSYVRRWLEQEYGPQTVMRGGLIVTTTLDLGLNDVAEASIRAHLAELSNPHDFDVSHNANNAALVSLDPHTGEIVAMVGSPDFFDSKTSGAVNASLALRQPGSAIKPITYAAALSRLSGFTAATPIFDVRTAFPTREGLPYVPVNYDGANHGPVSVRSALATSNNVAAVSVLQHVGLKAMLDQANAMGIHSLRSPDDYGLSLTLGGGEVRLLELTRAYGAFANAGERVDPYAVLEVANTRGDILFRHQPSVTKGQVALDPRVAWLISDILSDNTARAPAFGENSVLRLSRKAAVKTGTTQDFRDNWTVGYTPQLVTGVWVGNADGQPMAHISGVSGAGPIWHDFMEVAHRTLSVRWFTRPDGLVNVAVCELSGLLPTPDCAQTHGEWFIAGTQPTGPDTWHKRVMLDVKTGVTRVVLDLPGPLRDWAQTHHWPVLGTAPVNLSGSQSGSQPQVVITQPDAGAVYRAAQELPLSVQRLPVTVQIGGLEGSVSSVEVTTETGERIARFDRAPFSTFWPLVLGEHTLIARATLRDGTIQVSAPVRVTVRP